jgi:NAD+ synthase (glutamine-hydrolysing)
MRRLRVALAQINTTVGDLDGNVQLASDAIERARSLVADLVALPELTITGYPPEDLVLRPGFIRDNRAALDELAARVRGILVVVGFVGGGNDGEPVRNSAALLWEGAVAYTYNKIVLPNYGVFDERRYFAPGGECPVFDIAGVKAAVNICEDVWKNPGPSDAQCAAGAEVIVNINGSPYSRGKHETRHEIVASLARRNRAHVLYVNQVGGQDELVFDGGSSVYGPDGELIAEAARFEEELLVVDLEFDDAVRRSEGEEGEENSEAVGIAVALPDSFSAAKGERPAVEVKMGRPAPLEEEAEVYKALVLGTRDYLAKTGFKKVLIALSGGVDSALTAAIAVDAIGGENVVGVGMPSRYSSEGSVLDAKELADRLGITMWTLPIEPAHAAFEEMLRAQMEGTEPNTAEENLQARIRGVAMMTLSNKFGWLVLTTGNKSEMATGYATLYGDMAGGFAVIKDVPKTLVWRLCEYRNRVGPGAPIPQEVIDKPPSAELKPDQLDEDSLPPYEVLDRIIERYAEQQMSVEEIVKLEGQENRDAGPAADEETVRRMVRLIDLNEYKRRQAAPGIKITRLAFGRDRRLPIASRYRG